MDAQDEQYILKRFREMYAQNPTIHVDALLAICQIAVNISTFYPYIGAIMSDWLNDRPEMREQYNALLDEQNRRYHEQQEDN